MINSLGFVISINALTMETKGSGARLTREGDLILRPDVTAYLSETEICVSTV